MRVRTHGVAKNAKNWGRESESESERNMSERKRGGEEEKEEE